MKETYKVDIAKIIQEDITEQNQISVLMYILLSMMGLLLLAIIL